jgi:DNA-binding response OmpR family regulator
VGLRVYIIDADASLLKLFSFLLQSKGHQVQDVAGTCNNALIGSGKNTCPSDTLCADAIIVNTSPPVQEYIQQLTGNNHNGCKIPKRNIAIMTTYCTEEQRTALQEIGFSVIKKPFKLLEIDEWLAACARRLKIP